MEPSNKLIDEIVNIINQLPERQRDILLLRFGLYNGTPMTLNQIGRKYSITRERVRQVQNSSLQSVRDDKDAYKKLEPYISTIQDILDTHGKVMAEKHVIPVAKQQFSSIMGDRSVGEELVFLLNLGQQFKESKRTQEYNKFWYIDDGDDKKAKDIIKKFVKKITEKRDPLKKDDLYSLLGDMVKEQTSLDLKQEELKAILNLSRELKRNCLNLWGHKNWPEITPKNSGDYAFLAILSENKPLHFNDIPEAVNKYGINKKKLHAPTVHNVLIKDPRFVLIGKGRYALSKWGYIEGTVTDLITILLEKNDGEMSKDDLVQAILKQKDVKKSTILLNINRCPDVIEEAGIIKLKAKK